MKQVTIQDVARHAGVSRATVSRVLNRNPGVDEALRERVEQAIESLGYQPNRAAQRLRANSSDVLGLIIPDILNPVFVALARGVEDEAYKHQLTVMLCNSDDNPVKQQNYLRILQAERAAGVLIAPTSAADGDVLQDIRDNGLPVVLVDRKVDAAEFDVVTVDNVRGAYVAVTHLISQGYRRIAMIGGADAITPGRERPIGYQQALRQAGIPVDESLYVEGDFKSPSGYNGVRHLMSLPQPPDAIFTINSLTTLGAVQALRELNLRTPEDVALVGFDDLPFAEIMTPSLTVVAQPSYEIGQNAVRFLMRRRREPKAIYMTATLPPRLVVRQSCGIAVQPNGRVGTSR